MATKQQKTGAAVAAVIGVGALGLGAVALMRSNSGTNKDADTMFSGMLGGGATGGYSDTTGVPSTGGGSNIGETIGEVLTEVLQTTPQPQPTPIIINPAGNSGYEDIIPLINAVDNPSDERSDYKQVYDYTQEYDYSPVTVPYAQTAAQKAADADIRAGVASGEYKIIGLAGSENANTAVEYSPFTFTPTPKQQDISSYNVGKTGGATANTPAKNTNTGKTEQPAKKEPTTSSSGVTITSTPTTLGSAVISAVGRGVTTAVSTIGSFFGGLFGGR